MDNQQESKWGVWVRDPILGFGQRNATAVSAEEACKIVQGDLDAGKRGIVGALCEVIGALPIEQAEKITNEFELRAAFGMPVHPCEVCEGWFDVEHNHAEGVNVTE